MNLSGAIDALGTTTELAITRRAAATYSNGRPVPGSTTSLEVVATVVPAGPEDVQLLPEGRRSERTLQLFTKVALQAPRVGGVAGDIATVDGEPYEVLRVEDWNDAGAFWRALAVRSTP